MFNKVKLTELEKLRVATAKDVKKWIKPEKVSSGTGYCNLNTFGYKGKGKPTDLLNLGDSKKIASKFKKLCTVCAQGALLLSLVSKRNEFDFSKSNAGWEGSGSGSGNVRLDQDKFISRLQSVFEEHQLNLIESAFEKDYAYISSNPERHNEAAREFSDRYDNDFDRLNAIMDNIIANNGTFKP